MREALLYPGMMFSDMVVIRDETGDISAVGAALILIPKSILGQLTLSMGQICHKIYIHCSRPDLGINMKPCNVCIEAFDGPACLPMKHCSVEDVPGLSAEEALALVVSAKPPFDLDQPKVVLWVAQD